MSRTQALIRTQALLLRKVVHRESDAMLVLFTRDFGKLTLSARGAQRSQRRFGGALEPMHTLELELTGSRGDQLASAQVEIPRLHLVGDLSRLEAAGRALGWLREGAMERDPQISVWHLAVELLDRLNLEQAIVPELELATTGLALLSAWGWGLELEHCVRCSRACAPGKAAWVDAVQGGLVCSACGGARTRLDGELRRRLLAAATGESAVLLPEDAKVALALTEAALKAHVF